MSDLQQSDTVQRAAEMNEKRSERARQHLDDMNQKRLEFEEAQAQATGERDELAGRMAALEQAAWPYTGLFASPYPPRFQVIPAGMWRYQIPITPADLSMVPPSEEADPNVAIRRHYDLFGMVDTQAEDDPAREARQRALDEDMRLAEERGENQPFMPPRNGREERL